jgi:hypothetical protein
MSDQIPVESRVGVGREDSESSRVRLLEMEVQKLRELLIVERNNKEAPQCSLTIFRRNSRQ